LVLPNATISSESNAPTTPTLQKQVSKSEPRTTWGSHQIVQHRQPTDWLALRCKEASIHVDTWIHATTDTAIQLPWQQLPPSNNGAANSTREEQTDLPCAPQGASVQVQKQTRLFCHLHYAKSEEHNNDNDMSSSDYENSYVPLYVIVPDEELDGLTNSHDKLNTFDNTQEFLVIVITK
jgi:hypothetical protein